MHIIFSKKVLLDNLLPAMGTVSTKNTITTIEGVLIETLGGNTVRISTYDMSKGIRATFEALEVVEEGSFILNAQRFLQIVKLLGGDEVSVKIDAQYNGIISSEKSSFSMFALRGEDFPTLPELSGRKGFSVSSAVIKNKINRVVHSVSEADNRPMLCGVYFQIEGQDMEIVSCDGYSLSICRVRCDIEDIGEEKADRFSFILPGSALGELTKVLSDKDEKIEVMLARKHAVIKIDRMIFFTRMIDSDYIDYERIMPKDQTITVKVNRERFLDGLERANLIADEKIQGNSRSHVKVILEGDRITLTSSSRNGHVNDEMACEHEGEDLVIGFNCRYLMNHVRAAEGENILLKLKAPNQSLTIEPAEEKENESYFYMLLPVRMTEQ
ncbi:MAG: DNA polymerase III subunit beta [Clostridia bacterium]|nr:DNA polymerase III subunit beta [Clostridia bacterium]